MATVAPGRGSPSSRVVTTPLTVIAVWACAAAGPSASTRRREAARRTNMGTLLSNGDTQLERDSWRAGLYFRHMRRTKIVATIGPASRQRKVLESLAQAGVDVVRLNFSHGEHEQHLEVMEATREIAAHLGRPIALLQDLSGPKSRTARLNA